MNNFVRQGRKSPDDLADHQTPFVYNEWYVAALAEEVGETLMTRQILGLNVLMYRTMDGTAVAMEDRCPHRTMPLSQGVRTGDSVACAYHGMMFGPDGRCTRVPAQNNVPPAIRTRSFPIVEYGPLIWIWMGEVPDDGASRLIKESWLQDPGFATVSGYKSVDCSYVRLHENVLDLTHFPFVHGEVNGDLAFAQAPYKVTADGDKVCLLRSHDGEPVPEALCATMGLEPHRVNRRSEMWFMSPGLHSARDCLEDLEGDTQGQTVYNIMISHMFTPKTATSTHYFWAVGRDTNVDNQDLNTMTQQVVPFVLQQDVVILEAVENLWAQDDGSFREMSIPSDHAGILTRRIIARRAAEEASGKVSSESPIREAEPVLVE